MTELPVGRRRLVFGALLLVRPAFLFGGIGLMAVFAGVVSIFIFTSAEDAPTAPSQAGQGPGAYTVAEIAGPGGFLTALPTVSRLAG